MKCQIQKIDHSKCLDKERCKTDPCAVLAEHQKAVVFTTCGNEAIPGDYMCSICKGQFDDAMAKRKKAQDEAEAATNAAAALAEIAVTEAENAGTEQ